MSALEQDPLGTFSRVLGPEDQKKEWKEPEIDACDILEESSRYKCTYDDDIIIRYLTKERVSKKLPIGSLTRQLGQCESVTFSAFYSLL